MSAAARTWAITVSLRSTKAMRVRVAEVLTCAEVASHTSRGTRDCGLNSSSHRNRRPIAAFVLTARPPRLHGRMFPQVLADGFAQRAGAEAVDDAHGLLAFEQGAIEELVGFFERIVDALSDQVELRGDRRRRFRERGA